MSFAPVFDVVALLLIAGILWWTHDIFDRRISEAFVEMRAMRDAWLRKTAIRQVPSPDAGGLGPKPEKGRAPREPPVVAVEPPVPAAPEGGGIEGGIAGGVPGGVVGGVIGGIVDAPPAPAQSKSPLRVGGDVKAPVLISAPQPVYTEIARKARISGIVIVEAVVDSNGRVTKRESSSLCRSSMRPRSIS